LLRTIHFRTFMLFLSCYAVLNAIPVLHSLSLRSAPSNQNLFFNKLYRNPYITMRWNPKGRFRSLRPCNKQKLRSIYDFVRFLIINPIGDRCSAKSSFRKRFFGSFSSLKTEQIVRKINLVDCFEF